MAKLGALLDARYQAVGAESYRMAPTRAFVAIALTLLAGFGVGWPLALAWGGLLLLFEGAGNVVIRDLGAGAGAAPRWKLQFFFWNSCLAIPVWTAYGLILWAGKSEACAFAAVAFWCGQLLYAQNYCAKSPVMALQAGIPSAAAPLLIPFFIPRFHGVDQALVMSMLVLCVGHAVMAALDSMRTGEQLEAATADLVAGKRAAEAAEAKADTANQAKSDFLATMSHEIRTPLNGVLGMTQAMAMDKLSRAQRERLEVIRASGEALLTILNDVLDLSKVEAGKLELECIDFDLAEVVQGACQPFAVLAAGKGVGFSIDMGGAEGVYRADPTRVRQILGNLVSNALKFTDVGRIGVAVRAEGGQLILTISDTGEGIAADKIDGLFSSYTQADASTARRFGGTGLGLAICRQLAELMGGTIAVESAPGRGSTFTVTLAAPRVGDAIAADVADEGPASPVEAAGLRVLAAEDNAVNQLVLKTLLAHVGVEPVFVENGALAIDAWEFRGPWDLILMDVQMPVMDGPTAVRRIREREAETARARTPIVALSANAMSHQIAEYLAGGMDGHVAKPIEAGKLFAALDLAVGPAQEPARSDAA